MTNRPAIPVEVFLETGCRSSAPVLDAVHAAAESIALDVKVLFRDRDALEFLRRGVVICPATYIGGRLAFYGPMTADEILAFIHKHISILFPKGELS